MLERLSSVVRNTKDFELVSRRQPVDVRAPVQRGAQYKRF